MPNSRNLFAIWWQAIRFHFIPPSFLPAILGGVTAWAYTGDFYLWYFILTVLGVTFNHAALNMTDDYFDYQTSVDRAKDREKNPYSGGSGTLTSGLITPKQMYRVFMICYSVTIVIGLYLTVYRGWQVLIFGIFGMGSAYFYTAPPIKYGYRGLGELSQLINFSIIIGLGSYFVQVQSLSWEVLWIVLPLGFMMFSMITINEIPDEQDDRSGGKRTLVVIFGQKTAVWLYGLSMLTAYLIIIVTPIFKITSYWGYLSLITLPWFFKAFFMLYKNYQNPISMSPANMLTIRIHNVLGILLILAYMIRGLSVGFNMNLMWIPFIMLVLLYLPVALTVFFNVLSIKPTEKKE